MTSESITYAPIPPEDDRIGNLVIGAAIEVHRALGPGFVERIYAAALHIELAARGIQFEQERRVDVIYRGVVIPGHRIDLIVGGRVVIELKSVARVDPIWRTQVISYLRATRLRLGLLLNFNNRMLKDGIIRIVV